MKDYAILNNEEEKEIKNMHICTTINHDYCKIIKFIVRILGSSSSSDSLFSHNYTAWLTIDAYDKRFQHIVKSIQHTCTGFFLQRRRLEVEMSHAYTLISLIT